MTSSHIDERSEMKRMTCGHVYGSCLTKPCYINFVSQLRLPLQPAETIKALERAKNRAVFGHGLGVAQRPKTIKSLSRGASSCKGRVKCGDLVTMANDLKTIQGPSLT